MDSRIQPPDDGPPADGAPDLERHQLQALRPLPAKKSHSRLINDYIRTAVNATIALEFATTPQKYILGVTDEQYDAIISNKFKTYMGAIIAATANPETGENPTLGQLAQGSLTPHVEKMRMTATQLRRPPA